jgi:hypothetical protein
MFLIRLRADNLIPRPWGGFALAAFKGLPDPASHGRVGESFEVSAFPGDAEAGAHPSLARLDGGGEVPLPDLLRRDPEAVLGHAIIRRHGAVLPLLPKFLDVRGMLSIQAHPPGHPECYVVLAADAGASMRIGFRDPVTAADLVATCRAGRAAQEHLIDALAPGTDPERLQAALGPALADRSASVDSCRTAIAPFLDAARRRDCDPVLETLVTTCRAMLDAMHEIPVRPGLVVFNATPERLRRDGVCSAEVHALGHPGGREILLLEIRRPGPTFRLWDHARFPTRPLHIDEAVGALSTEATRIGDFMAGDLADSTPGVARPLVECPDFMVEHLPVDDAHPVTHDTLGTAVTLHGIEGTVRVRARDGEALVRRGESALVPAATGTYEVHAEGAPAAVVAARVRFHGRV